MRMRKGWDTQADNWVRFARTPGHDAFYDLMNLPAFLSLLPAPWPPDPGPGLRRRPP